jgi:hypothetical protein
MSASDQISTTIQSDLAFFLNNNQLNLCVEGQYDFISSHTGTLTGSKNDCPNLGAKREQICANQSSEAHPSVLLLRRRWLMP